MFNELVEQMEIASFCKRDKYKDESKMMLYFLGMIEFAERFSLIEGHEVFAAQLKAMEYTYGEKQLQSAFMQYANLNS
jgi:hypothetical protein